LIQKETTKRLICFGVNGASIFQGCPTSVMVKEKFAPCMMVQHCMAHQTNLVVQVLSNLPMVAKSEDLLQSLYFYFSNSPKHQLKFHFKLAEIMETRRLKIL
jgi:hypothetical protein